MSPLLRIGLTGGIGSGKSTVCKMFADLGVPVIDADEVARELTERGKPGMALIKEAFGHDVLTASGDLDRPRLRALIFRDEIARLRLESVLHPLIWRKIDDMLMHIHHPFCIICIPLLIEKKVLHRIDRVLVVDTTREQQIQRATERDKTRPENIEKIMAVQVTRAERLAVAHDVIHNNADLPALQRQVDKLNVFYNELSARTGAHDAKK